MAARPSSAPNLDSAKRRKTSAGGAYVKGDVSGRASSNRRYSAPRKNTYYGGRKKKGQNKIPRPLTAKMAIAYASPFGKKYPPKSATNLGHFLCQNNIARHTLICPADTERLMMFCPSATNGYICFVWDSTGANQSDHYKFSPTHDVLTHAGGILPVGWKPLRAGIKIRSLTPADSRSGFIQVLPTTAPVSVAFVSGTLDITTLTYGSLTSMVKNNLDAKSISAEQLSGTSHSFINFPASFSEYTSWGEGDIVTNTLSSAADVDLVAQSWVDAEKSMSLSSTLIYFPPSSITQTYLIEVGLQSAARYPENSVLGSLMKTPTGSANAQEVRQHHLLVSNAGGHAVFTEGFGEGGIA